MFAIHDRLMKALIVAERLPEAAEVAERLADALDNPKFYLRAASIWAQLRQWDKAAEILTRGAQRFPGSQELGQALAEIGSQSRKTPEPQTTTARAAVNV